MDNNLNNGELPAGRLEPPPKRGWFPWWMGITAVIVGGVMLGTAVSHLNPFRHTGNHNAVRLDDGTPRTFYVSPEGKDVADGLSPGTAWHSLARASSAVLRPGDRLLLRGGREFWGTLRFRREDAGNARSPVVVGSYGTGRATIRTDGSAISVDDTAGVDIRDLRLIGTGAAYRKSHGINLYSTLRSGDKLEHVAISGVEVSGFKIGIGIGAGRDAAGFRNVRVNESVLHDNMEAGLATLAGGFDPAAPTYAHEDIHVSRVEAYRNIGDPTNLWRNTGSGIVLGNVRNGVVEWSRAYENGEKSVAPEGGVGIWTYDSTKIVLQHNVSHHNRTSRVDGGGFDIDQNVSSSILQYNVSYENDGAGYMAYTGLDNQTHARNVIRFNISVDDCRKLGPYGALTLSGRLTDTEIYHNTLVMTSRAAARAPALRLGEITLGRQSGVNIRNNVFISHSGGPTVDSHGVTPDQARLLGNAYFNGTSAPLFVWGGKSYWSLRSWRADTDQEITDTDRAGIDIDPQLVDSDTPLRIADPAKFAEVTGIKLKATSPLIGKGMDLSDLWSVDHDMTDFFGTTLAELVPDVGAAHSASSKN